MTTVFRMLPSLCLWISSLISSPCTAAEPLQVPPDELVAPVDRPLKHPFTEKESMACGRWGKSSQDYPFFGAPRDRNARRHAGVDLYPEQGAGSPVKAVADGVVIKVAPFFTRRDGEVTYAVLVDHGGFVANYAELRKPDLGPGRAVGKGGVIGRIGGTRQLHFELYTQGTRDWSRWLGERPANLVDPTEILTRLLDRQ